MRACGFPPVDIRNTTSCLPVAPCPVAHDCVGWPVWSAPPSSAQAKGAWVPKGQRKSSERRR
jgi:hypothetical protein